MRVYFLIIDQNLKSPNQTSAQSPARLTVTTPAKNMATGDGGRMREGKDIPPGSTVACTTNFDENFEGEVMAFDYGTKFIVISILLI